jgi:hypothetical protein
MGLKERKYLFDSWPIMLREIAYHKDHKESENLPFKSIWKKNNDMCNRNSS